MRSSIEYSAPRFLLGYSVVVPSTSQSYNGDDDSIISNSSCLLIIVPAVLLLMLCVVALREILRCVLRFNARFPLESAEAAASRLSSKGLNKDELRKIPVMVYEPEVLKVCVINECPICLGEFEQGEKLRILPRCSHGFHVKCIDEWFLSHSSCPICRQPLLLQPTT
ncbi:hypothetical protein RND71_006787 [Anisodus tanguticus]|uniref:RING-type E3 ubiquitin transferase n=1 Tax=Anisodus tanguticus TaxID=243964 RepID=A0AAE1SU26_9SOLA|nr:hypothetical protein RND71_006787 [Anisodus tanguticus]